MSIASRVVPARSETITRSSPTKRLTSDDLPTLGRPITARRTASSALDELPSGSGPAATIRSSRSPGAEPLGRGDGDRVAQPQRVELRG